MTDQDDAWRAIGQLRQRIQDLEDKLARRDEVISAHGEVLDAVRNRVYDLEHSRVEQ